MDQNADIFPAYRLVAQFADGQRLTFDGLTDQQAQTRMEAAQALHGDICWYDGVTDQHYENGHFYKLTPPPPTINMMRKFIDASLWEWMNPLTPVLFDTPGDRARWVDAVFRGGRDGNVCKCSGQGRPAYCPHD